MSIEACPGCGARFPTSAGPIHSYMESSPACWAAYGEVLAREYSDIRFGARHQLTVDSYAVQHPGRASSQSIQSVGLHLISLCLQLEQGADSIRTREILQRSKSFVERFAWLEPPADRGSVTVADVLQMDSAQEHIDRVDLWSRSAWNAWRVHHPTVHRWINDLGLLPDRRPHGQNAGG